MMNLWSRQGDSVAGSISWEVDSVITKSSLTGISSSAGTKSGSSSMSSTRVSIDVSMDVSSDTEAISNGLNPTETH